MSCNRTQLCGRIETLGALRFSPAGVALVEFTIAHSSMQTEADVPRKVNYVLHAIAAGDMARQVAQLPKKCTVKATGFLAQADRANAAMVLHVQNIELIE